MLCISHVNWAIELGEVSFTESFKGTKTYSMLRKSYKRCKEIKNIGISKDKICVSTLLDIQSNLIIKSLYKNRITHKELDRLYKWHIEPQTYKSMQT